MGACIGSQKPKPTGSQLPKNASNPAQRQVNNVPLNLNPNNSEEKRNKQKGDPENPLGGSSQREQILKSWKKHPERFVLPEEKNKIDQVIQQGVDDLKREQELKEEEKDKQNNSPIKQIGIQEVVQKVIEDKTAEPNISAAPDSKINNETSAEKNNTGVNMTSTERRKDLSNLKAISEVSSFMENQGDTIKKSKENVDQMFNFQKEKIDKYAGNIMNDVQPIDPESIKPEVIGEKGPQSQIVRISEIGKTFQAQSSKVFGEEGFLQDYQVDFYLPIFQITLAS